jgi:DNA/RNA endonuclease G (NUC1)
MDDAFFHYSKIVLLNTLKSGRTIHIFTNCIVHCSKILLYYYKILVPSYYYYYFFLEGPAAPSFP